MAISNRNFKWNTGYLDKEFYVCTLADASPNRGNAAVELAKKIAQATQGRFTHGQASETPKFPSDEAAINFMARVRKVGTMSETELGGAESIWNVCLAYMFFFFLSVQKKEAKQ